MLMRLARIVGMIVILEAERSDRRDLRHVLAGFRPMKVPGIAGKDDDVSHAIP